MFIIHGGQSSKKGALDLAVEPLIKRPVGVIYAGNEERVDFADCSCRRQSGRNLEEASGETLGLLHSLRSGKLARSPARVDTCRAAV